MSAGRTSFNKKIRNHSGYGRLLVQLLDDISATSLPLQERMFDPFGSYNFSMKFRVVIKTILNIFYIISSLGLDIFLFEYNIHRLRDLTLELVINSE